MPLFPFGKAYIPHNSRMHLQSLELFGFKSFADKTAFLFHQGVTAVVGPNGCGKSNVCDAIRWVLGEQSAKAMRGGEMADVIFNGTDSRKPLGFAEVSLTFDDCGSDLGVDWHDVRVTRRVYRDGNSEYFLNKTLCRLKDIQSLFADTGVGRSAYSIMEQGKIDLILSSRPEDRRSVFEEAAGITKYKGQKKEALRKLEATDANLLRVGDIIKEVKRQIGSLQRQAGKARRYQALHADLRVLDTHFSYRKLRALAEELGKCATTIARVSEREQLTRNEVESGETMLAALRDELDAIDVRLDNARDRFQRVESEIGTQRQRIQWNEQRATELDDLIRRGQQEIAVAEGRLRGHEAEIDAANALLEETVRLLTEKKAGLGAANEDARTRKEARLAVEEALHACGLNLSRDEMRFAAVREDLRDLTLRRDATRQEAQTLTNRIAEADTGHDRLQAQVEISRVSAEEESRTVDGLLARVRTQEDDLRARQGTFAEVERQLTSLDRAIAEKESRHDVLRQLNEEGEGLAKGSQALLKRNDFKFDGALAAQLEVVPEFVAAISAALGRNLHALVLREPARAPEIISHLHQQQLGQAALLIADARNQPPSAPAQLPAGALGWAAEKVNAPEALRPAVLSLLHGVALFPDLEAALVSNWRALGVSIATLRGEFISADGILFGGSGKPDSLLERKTRIDALALELAKLGRERARTQQKRHTFEAQIATAQQELEATRSLHQSAHTAQTISTSKTNELEREHHLSARDLEILRSEHDTLTRQIASAAARLSELAEQQTNFESSIATLTREMAEWEAGREEAVGAETASDSQLADLRLAAATEEQRHESLLAQRAPMLARQAELTELIATRSTEIEAYHSRLHGQTAETESAQALIAARTSDLAGAEEEIARLRETRATGQTNIHEHEGTLRQARTRQSELQEERGAHSIRQTQLQLQIENLQAHAQRRYQVDLNEFEPDAYANEKVLRAHVKHAEGGSGRPETSLSATEQPAAPTEDELSCLIAELTRQLDAMGPVNLDAVQEYDELEERYRFLETQNNDLTNSKRELLDVIARINQTTQALFAETFAQVRVNFREMFGELFGGGRADLQLMDENDALNCGIEIIAKPPGKQLQSVSLLSGGERTMTAVALLFAIYMVRPSPFCVLDEMDAPLDESNINRFIKVLERFVQQSQFIIITHNKRTIAKADVLYGVTMEERGVSKLVGMKLSAAKEPASANGAHEAMADRPQPEPVEETSERELSLAISR